MIVIPTQVVLSSFCCVALLYALCFLRQCSKGAKIWIAPDEIRRI